MTKAVVERLSARIRECENEITEAEGAKAAADRRIEKARSHLVLLREIAHGDGEAGDTELPAAQPAGAPKKAAPKKTTPKKTTPKKTAPKKTAPGKTQRVYVRGTRKNRSFKLKKGNTKREMIMQVIDIEPARWVTARELASRAISYGYVVDPGDDFDAFVDVVRALLVKELKKDPKACQRKRLENGAYAYRSRKATGDA